MLGDARKLVHLARRRFFSPKILRELKTAGVMPPRKRSGGEPLKDVGVLKFRCTDDLGALFEAAGTQWDRYLTGMFRPEHRILIKINLNTADPYPASTCPDFLSVFVDFLQSRGLRNLLVGDCASLYSLPTRRVAMAMGIASAIEGRAELVCFDESPWVQVPIQGYFLRQVTVPQIAMEVDRIISLANLKTHSHADFTMGFKLAVGFMHPVERKPLHQHHVREKSVEVSLAVPPDLVIVDGRSAFLTLGPNRGRLEQTNVALLGDSLLKVDAEAYRELYEAKKAFDCVEHFDEDPYDSVQLRHARKLGFR